MRLQSVHMAYHTMLRRIAATALLAGGILLGMQMMVELPGNPPVHDAIEAPPAVQAILRRACFDCHSNETRWPWYCHVAPTAWMAAHDVSIGRKEINFSEWGTYKPATRVRKLEWLGRALRQETMPPWPFRILHPESRLTAADAATLQQWAGRQLDAAQAHSHNR